MKTETYKVQLKTEDGYKLVPVKGYPVTYPDFPGMEFFVHKSLDIWDGLPSKYWTISEKSTGYGVGLLVYAITRRQDAIRYGHERLQRKGLKAVRKAIKMANPMEKEVIQ